MTALIHLANEWQCACGGEPLADPEEFASQFRANWQHALDLVRAGQTLGEEEKRALHALIKRSDTVVNQLHAEHPLVQSLLLLSSPSGGDDVATVQQIAHLLSAHAAAMLSAAAVKSRRPEQERAEDSKQLLATCADHLAAAWPDLCGGAFVGDFGQGSPMASISATDRLMQATFAGVEAPVWLAARRLLSFLAGEPEAKTLQTNTACALLVYPSGEGATCDVDISLVAEGLLGFYVDPIALGLTAVDRCAQQSLAMAWKLSQARLRERSEGHSAPRLLAIRVSPSLPASILQLDGDSAGGLLACGLHASACGESLDSLATASVSLRLRDPKLMAHDTLNEADVEVGGVDAASLGGKLAAATNQGLTAVALEHAQVGLVVPTAGLAIHPVDSFHQLYEMLVHGARCEAVLAEYSRDRVAKWEREASDIGYIPLHYGMLTDGSPTDGTELADAEDPVAARESRYQRLVAKPHGNDANQRRRALRLGREPQADHSSEDFAAAEQTELRELLEQGGMRICVTEDAGAGKTVFSKRMCGFLSAPAAQVALFGGRPGLVVRHESREDAWPDSPNELRHRLTEAVRNACQRVGRGVTSQQVVEFALAQKRVTVILDALDQVIWKDATEKLDALWSFFNDEASDGKDVRLIVTGRSQAVTDNHVRFRAPVWRFATIFGFEEEQLATFFVDYCDRSFRELFPHYDEVKELLRVPVLAAMARDMAKQKLQMAGGRLPIKLDQLRTRGDFYRKAHAEIVERAPKTDLKVTPQSSRRWEHILAASAFTFMTRGRYNYTIVGLDPVADFLDEASRWRGEEITDGDWDEIGQFSALTDHRILDGVSDRTLSWKHKGWMEYFCRVYLARYATRAACEVVRQFTNHPQWYWPWRFAIDMASAVRGTPREHVLAGSLALLFERPDPASGRRPTELMYRAWHLFDGEGDPQVLKELGHTAPDGALLSGEAASSAASQLVLPDAAEVLATFRAEFWDRVAAGEEVARSLVPDQRLIDAGLQGTDEADRRRPQRHSYARCPNAGCPEGFAMGDASGQYSDERPKHDVFVRGPFHMLSTPVTQQQFTLFDKACAREQIEQRKKYAPDAECPAIYTSWYDAFCFSKWLDGRLPTEIEWEYACRAGTTSAFHFGHALNGTEANCNGGYPFGTQEEGPYLGRTSPVGSYTANPWGLHDMHGNVWEWCGDWYDGDWYTKRQARFGEVAPDDGGPPAGSARVLRGGSWIINADRCRSSSRFCGHPAIHGSRVGFRVLFALSQSSL